MPSHLPGLLCAVTCFAVCSPAQVLDITLIADTNTPVPFGTGNFYNWGATNIAVDASGRVAFTSTLDEGEVITGAKEGVYLYDSGSISRVADRNTAAPGQGGDNFSGFIYLDIHDGRVIFGARAGASNTQNLYAYESGSLSLHFSPATLGPGGAVMTSGGQSPSIDGDVSVFSSAAFDPGTSAFGYGYFSHDGSSTAALVTSLDQVGGSGGSNPVGFAPQSMAYRNGTLGLWASLSGGTTNGSAIVGFHEDTGIQLIAGVGTTVPGESVAFEGVSFAGVMGTQVVFSGTWTDGEGIFRANVDGSSLEKLMDLTQLVPESSSSFEDISWAVAGDDHLVFRGDIGGGEYGLYSMTNGVISTLLDTTMSLDGNQVAALSTEGIHGIEGDYVAFRVGFESGLEGVYRFQLSGASAVPEPSTWALLLGMGALAGVVVVRRKPRMERSPAGL